MGFQRRHQGTRPAEQGFQIDAAALTDAFDYAWVSALKAELITAENVAQAPSQLLRAVLLAAQEEDLEPSLLGVTAFDAWREAIGITRVLENAVPPTSAIN